MYLWTNVRSKLDFGHLNVIKYILLKKNQILKTKF
jgi:hypothetical protein